MIITVEIPGISPLLSKQKVTDLKEENMKKPCSVLERSVHLVCSRKTVTNVHMTVCTYVFSCIYVFSLRLSAQPAKSNGTLVARNPQHLNPHFYCPLLLGLLK